MTTIASQSPKKSTAQNPARPATVRVAVIGCGAVAQQFHLPVLVGHRHVRLAALVDANAALAQAQAQAYGVSTVLTDAESLDRSMVDAAIIATPPNHHAPCAIALAQRKIHVLIEKPMAIGLPDAKRVVEAAKNHGVVAAVGLFRRLFPSADLLRATLASGRLGRPLSFSVEAGSIYAWPLASLGNMLKPQAGGGVLIDIGTHVIDHLLHVFNASGQVVKYRDNARGGIETDCELELRLKNAAHEITGQIVLSRTRKLRGTIRIDCERATLEVRTTEPYRVRVIPRDIDLTDPDTGKSRPYELGLEWQETGSQVGYEQFRVELDDFVDAIRHGSPARLSATSALPTVALVDACYAQRQVLPEPWVEAGIDNRPPARQPEVRTTSRPQRVLLTGATGFLGCRVAELLRLREGIEVRALVHNPGNAARLARLPVEMTPGDLRSPDQIAKALHGCDAIVHCAIGTEYGQSRAIRQVTVDGTLRLAEAAQVAGVKRFVHISSIAVHGYDVRGTIDQTTPIQPKRGDLYSQTKAAAERHIARCVDQGLPAVVIRPANIYGPYCPNLVVRPLSFLARDALRIVGNVDRSSNTVYVDNVAHAIHCALTAPAVDVVGQTVPLGQDDTYSWSDFFAYFATTLGGELSSVSLEEFRRLKPRQRFSLLRWIGSWGTGAKTILTSAEFKQLGQRVLDTRPWGTLPRYLLENATWFRRSVEAAVGAGGATVYHREESAGNSAAPMMMNPIDAHVSNTAAQQLLGYAPLIGRAKAMDLTRQWVAQSGLLGGTFE